MSTESIRALDINASTIREELNAQQRDYTEARRAALKPLRASLSESDMGDVYAVLDAAEKKSFIDGMLYTLAFYRKPQAPVLADEEGAALIAELKATVAMQAELIVSLKKAKNKNKDRRQELQKENARLVELSMVKTTEISRLMARLNALSHLLVSRLQLKPMRAPVSHGQALTDQLNVQRVGRCMIDRCRLEGGSVAAASLVEGLAPVDRPLASAALTYLVAAGLVSRRDSLIVLPVRRRVRSLGQTSEAQAQAAGA